jgi:FkbM family methyltransferase
MNQHFLDPIKHKFSNFLKKMVYFKGESYMFNQSKLKFLAGTRPVRRLNKFLKNEVNRNDILQINFFEKNFSQNDILYDIGAHHGHYSIFAATKCLNQNQIFSFEPDSSALRIFKRNIELNNFGNKIIVLEYAISNTDGEIYFDFRNGNANSKISSSKTSNTIKVQSKKLDSLINDLPSPTYVKIDVEGAEFEVLKGATTLLEDKTVTFICELHPFAWKEFDVDFDSFIELLSRYDRKMKLIDSDNNIFDLPFYGTVIF